MCSLSCEAEDDVIAEKGLKSPVAFWVTQTALLAPLGVFWISVVTGSEFLDRVLFGANHTPFRDILPVLILPGIALLLSLLRLKSGLRADGDAISKPDRNGTMIIAGLVTCSILIVCAYSVTETLHEARVASDARQPR